MFMGIIIYCLPIAPGDYISVSQQLNFTSSVTEYRVNISIVNDNLVEDVEHFIANLNLISAVGNVLINPPQATVNIHSDDSMLLDLSCMIYVLYRHCEGRDSVSTLDKIVIQLVKSTSFYHSFLFLCLVC